MALINNVPSSDLPVSLVTWLNQAYVILFSIQESGTTAQRPTSKLWVGRQYYDKTLNKPIWVNSVNPVVWKDAAGTTV